MNFTAWLEFVLFWTEPFVVPVHHVQFWRIFHHSTGSWDEHIRRTADHAYKHKVSSAIRPWLHHWFYSNFN